MKSIIGYEKRPKPVVWCPGTEAADSLVLRPDLGLEGQEQARLARLPIRVAPALRSSEPSPERPHPDFRRASGKRCLPERSSNIKNSNNVQGRSATARGEGDRL